MTLKPWHSFAGFAVAMMLGFSGVTCLSIGVIDRDLAEKSAVQRATLEENVRLSLWRMDSELAPLIANESTRPHVDWTQVSPRSFLERSPYVRMHFQFDETGALTSPDETGEVALLGGLITAEQLSRLLEQRREVAGREGLASQLALNASNPASGVGKLDSFSAPVQSYKNAAEWGARARVAQQARDYNNFKGAQQEGMFDANALAAPSEMAMLPLWIGDELLLVRRATIGGRAVPAGGVDRLAQAARQAVGGRARSAAVGLAGEGGGALGSAPRVGCDPGAHRGDRVLARGSLTEHRGDHGAGDGVDRSRARRALVRPLAGGRGRAQRTARRVRLCGDARAPDAADHVPHVHRDAVGGDDPRTRPRRSATSTRSARKRSVWRTWWRTCSPTPASSAVVRARCRRGSRSKRCSGASKSGSAIVRPSRHDLVGRADA